MLANAGNALAASPPASQVQLSARDQQRLSGLACTPIGSGGVDAVQARRQGAGETVAEVRCQPHATSYSVPVARLASCAGSAGRWQCAATGDVLRMTMDDGSVLSVTAVDLPLKAAAEAAREAAKLTIRPFYRPALQVMRDACAVSRSKAPAAKGVESFTIRCGEAVITLNKDCWNGGCRFFIPFALNY
jgi:hypothetical protein